MTSVKELGESLRRRHTAPEGAGEAMFGAVGSIYTILLITGGCLALALGAGLASVVVVAPDLAWMAESLERMGIRSGAVLAGGTALLGSGLVCKALSQVQRALLNAVRRSSAGSQLAESQEEIQGSLAKVHFALRVLQESTKGLLEVAHEQSLKREGRDHEDAVYHLAASLDQLGVRLEDRLDSQQSGLERRLGSLDEALEETRRYITEWLDEGGPAGHPEELDGPAEDAIGALEAPRAQEEQGDRLPEQGGSDRPAPGNRRERGRELAPKKPSGERVPRRIDSRRPSRDEELEIVVTLEDEDRSAPRGRARASVSPPRSVPHPASRTPLGVLDVLDDLDPEGPDHEGPDEERPEDESNQPGEVAAAPANASFLFDPELSAKLDRLTSTASGAAADAPRAVTGLEQKLAQLHSLLSDSGLRRALEDLRGAAPRDFGSEAR